MNWLAAKDPLSRCGLRWRYQDINASIYGDCSIVNLLVIDGGMARPAGGISALREHVGVIDGVIPSSCKAATSGRGRHVTPGVVFPRGGPRPVVAALQGFGESIGL